MPNAAPSTISTNVRIQPSDGRAVCLGLGAWALAVSLAAFDGVFARMPAAVELSLAAFAALFAAATYAWDGGVRARVDQTPLAVLAFLALVGDALLAFLAFDESRTALHGADPLLVFFVVPLALAAHLPLAGSLARAFTQLKACEVTWRDPGRDLSSR